MRSILLALIAAGALGATPDPVSARDLREWSYDWDTRPRPQYYNYPDRQEGRRDGRRSLRYYCGLGSQTPRSLRDDCRRAGYW